MLRWATMGRLLCGRSLVGWQRLRNMKNNAVYFFSKTRIPHGTSFETMVRYKGLLQEAAKRSLDCLADGSAISFEQRIYWTLVLLRQHRRPEGRAAKRALRVYESLQEFVYDGVLNYENAHKHLTTLTCQKAQTELDNLNSETSHDDIAAKRAKVNALGEWLALWSSKRRRFTCTTILRPNGESSASNFEGAELLADHWQPIFSEKNTQLKFARVCIGDYIQKAPNGIQWQIDMQEFTAWLVSRPDCGCSTDMLPYSAFIYAPPCVHDCMYQMYRDL